MVLGVVFKRCRSLLGPEAPDTVVLKETALVPQRLVSIPLRARTFIPLLARTVLQTRVAPFLWTTPVTVGATITTLRVTIWLHLLGPMPVPGIRARSSIVISEFESRICIRRRREGGNILTTWLMARVVESARKALNIKRFALVVETVRETALRLCTLFIRTMLGLLCKVVCSVPVKSPALLLTRCRRTRSPMGLQINLTGLLIARTRLGWARPTPPTTEVRAADPLEFAGFAIRTNF